MSDTCRDRLGSGDLCGKPCLPSMTVCYDHVNKEALVLRLHEYVKLTAEVRKLREVLEELHATVKGECPSLLDEDSGGSAWLGMAIEEALGEVRHG